MLLKIILSNQYSASIYYYYYYLLKKSILRRYFLSPKPKISVHVLPQNFQGCVWRSGQNHGLNVTAMKQEEKIEIYIYIYEL